MKKFVVLLVIAVFVLMTACNYDAVNFKYEYNYAYLRLANGEVIEGDLSAWGYYDGDTFYLTIDGKTYVANSYNFTLLKKEG